MLVPDSGASVDLTASVVIVTYNRPDHVRTCLQHIAEQTVPALETIVVDASPESTTYTVVTQEFPAVRYLRNPFGAGTTATSRDIALRQAVGDIIAFVDDDAYAQPDWLETQLAQYRDPSVGGVGGRARNGIAGEENEGQGQIGMLLPNGTLTGNFAADPGRVIEVDHMLGANHSYRRDAVLAIGGIHDAYPGTCLREETDTALRLKRAGWRLVYEPASVVDHQPGPYAKGKRFDRRYTYYSHRNHLVLLSRTVGVGDPMFRRYIGVSGGQAVREAYAGVKRVREVRTRGAKLTGRSVAGGASRAAAITAGLLGGARAVVSDRSATRRER